MKKNMEWFLAYAKIYGLMGCTFKQVLGAINADNDIDYWLDCTDGEMEDYVDEFLKQYREIEKYGLLDEVCRTIQEHTTDHYMCTIWEAAREWDVQI